MDPKRIIVGITGASGAPYAKRLLERLAQAECEIHLLASALGRRLMADECGIKRLDADELTGGRGALLTIHNENDLGGPVASGSFRHDGMVIVPCSGNTMSKVAYGLTDNQLQRAAMVTLKERRRLILAQCAETVRIASLLLEPFLPQRMADLQVALGAPAAGEPWERRVAWGGLKAGTRMSKVALYPRIEAPANPA